MLLGFEVAPVFLRIRKPESFDEPSVQRFLIFRHAPVLQVDCDIHIFKRLQRCAIGYASGVQHLDELEGGVFSDIPFQLLAHPAYLLASRFDVIAAEVDTVIGKIN
jgi:hypothetical protein